MNVVAPSIQLSDEEIDRVVAGVRAGAAVVVGGSRCHTTYRGGADGELVAEDFDEGMTSERPCSEATLRAIIARETASFLDVLRAPLRTRLRDALLDLADISNDDLVEKRRAARARLEELFVYGGCLARADLLDAYLAWPEAKPEPEAVARVAATATGLDAYHAIMSALGYASDSPAAGRVALRLFEALAAIFGDLPRWRRYRAAFRAMTDDFAGAIDDLEWERAHASSDDSDAPYLAREIEITKERWKKSST